jgi:hypothetical protein
MQANAPMIARAIRAVLFAAGVVGLLAASSLAPSLSATRLAAAEPAREYLIKAALIYNFAKFAEWPARAFASDSDRLNVCVLGKDPFGEALESIADKPIRGRLIGVHRVQDIEAGLDCHLLFISDSEQSHLPTILGAIANRPILTISDMPDFTQAGGIIRLKTNLHDQIRFEINVVTARRVGLRLSSQLLSLAEIASY